jgi:dienelactone hydrolase
VTGPARGQVAALPDTVVVRSGALVLHGLLWRPVGPGPFPAVLFNHGGYSATDTVGPGDPEVLGTSFVAHGYVFLFLFRPGVGLSRDQGIPEGTRMSNAFVAYGQNGRNTVQLELLEADALTQAVAGLAFLRALPEVDPGRVAVAGHSFGGSLTLLVTAHDTMLRAAVVFSGSARSWQDSPALRQHLLDAVQRVSVPVLFLHAANDYSTAPGIALAAALTRAGKFARLKIYPAVGRTTAEGHNAVYRSVSTWEADVFAFLDAHLR